MEMQVCAICRTAEELLRCAKCKNAGNDIQALPNNFPLATATYGNVQQQQPNHLQQHQQQQQQMQQNSMTLNNVNGVNYDAFTGNFMNNIGAIVDDSSTLNNSGLAIENPQTMSVMYGVNENVILNSQQNENMLVDPTMELQQYFMDTNINESGNVSDDTTRQILDNFNDTILQEQQHEQHHQEQAQNHQQHYQNQTNEQQLQLSHQHQQQQTQHQQTYAQFRNQNSQHEKSSSYRIGQGDENVMANFNERRYEELCHNIISDMNQYGLSVVDDFLGVEKGMDILGEVHDMYCAGVFQDGQLVNNRKTEQDLNRTIRGDKITWVKGVEQGCTSVGYLINQIDAVICRANAMKDNGKLGNYNIKERTKAMVACYPGSGTHYVTHVDNPNKDGRVITAIYYLNVDWDSKRSGGVLRIFPEASNTVADIEPKFDRLIFFWSDKRNPHEVQPSHRTRYAITVWYFDANERETALQRCKYANVTKNTSESSSSSSKSIKGNHHSHQHLSSSSFSNTNENSNPNLNTNTNFKTNSTQQHNKMIQSKICT